MTSLETSSSYERRAIEGLKEAGLRVTQPRLQVISVLASADMALNADSVHQRVLANGGMIGLASVYRFLAALTELGLLLYVGIADGYYANRALVPTGRRSLIVMESDTRKLIDIKPTRGLIHEIEDLLSDAGYVPSMIKIEVLALAQ